MNIDKNILLNVIENQSIESSSLKVLYDWSYPDPNSNFAGGEIGEISSEHKLVFNALHGIDDHLINGDPDKLSAESMFGLSVGTSHSAIASLGVVTGNGVFFGNDIIYISNSISLSSWTVLIDIEELECSTTKNKGRILFTNKNQVTDSTGFTVGVNGASCLFYEGSDSGGNKITKTLVNPIGEKSLIAVARSNVTNSVSVYIYNPITETMIQKSFSTNEIWSNGNWCLGGTFVNFANDVGYEKFEGKINSFTLFDSSLNALNILKIFQAFPLTSYSSARYEEVATQVPKAGQYVERQVEDGFETTGYEYMQSHVTTNEGKQVIMYNKVPKVEKKYKTVNQYIAGVGTVTKMIRTLIPETKTKDTIGSQKYVEKCILLDKEIDKTQRIEFYSRDNHVGNCGKKATFSPSDSSFYVDQPYEDPINIIIYLNGLLIEPSVDYQIVNGKTIERINGVFLETDEVIYDTYGNEKFFTNFYGYGGDVFLYGHKGKDVYLDGKKLIYGVDYEDYSTDFLIIHADGLNNGRIGLVTRPVEVTNSENFYNKYYHCNNYNVIDEQVWIDGKRVYKEKGYSLTCECNLNNSNNKSQEKTTIIYNNNGNFFNI